MDKLLQFGRKAWYIVRVMTGHEERRIRSYRLQLQKRLEMAQARKEELRKQPEQVILSDVRQVVQQMQALNQHLDEAEAAIDDYFKPIDKNAKKGGPGAAVVSTVCNRKVPGSSPSLCTFVGVRLGAITTLPQTPLGAGSLRHWVRPFDKNAKIITDMQLEKEESQMKEMLKVMQEQIKMQREITMRRAEAASVESNDTKVGEKVAEIPPKQETVK